jgi:hypothetical protein
MAPAVFVKFDFEALRRARFGISVTRIARWTRLASATTGAGVLALERLIRMGFTHPAAILTNEAFHDLGPCAGLFTRPVVSPCAALFGQGRAQRRSYRARQADVQPFASRPRGIPLRCA